MHICSSRGAQVQGSGRKPAGLNMNSFAHFVHKARQFSRARALQMIRILGLTKRMVRDNPVQGAVPGISRSGFSKKDLFVAALTYKLWQQGSLTRQEKETKQPIRQEAWHAGLCFPSEICIEINMRFRRLGLHPLVYSGGAALPLYAYIYIYTAHGQAGPRLKLQHCCRTTRSSTGSYLYYNHSQSRPKLGITVGRRSGVCGEPDRAGVSKHAILRVLQPACKLARSRRSRISKQWRELATIPVIT